MIDVNSKPSQISLEVFHEVLEWIIFWHEKNEPYATVLINAAREVQDNVPYEVEEFEVE
jgi:hypothetical protein